MIYNSHPFLRQSPCLFAHQETDNWKVIEIEVPGYIAELELVKIIVDEGKKEGCKRCLEEEQCAIPTSTLCRAHRSHQTGAVLQKHDFVQQRGDSLCRTFDAWCVAEFTLMRTQGEDTWYAACRRDNET